MLSNKMSQPMGWLCDYGLLQMLRAVGWKVPVHTKGALQGFCTLHSSPRFAEGCVGAGVPAGLYLRVAAPAVGFLGLSCLGLLVAVDPPVPPVSTAAAQAEPRATGARARKRRTPDRGPSGA